MTSWLSSPAAHVGLLDEIAKIGSAEAKNANREQILKALKTIGLAAAGSGIGWGVARGLQKVAPHFLLAKKPVTQKMLGRAQIGLPIMGGLGGILGSRYRSAVDEGMFGKPKSSTNARR